MLKSSIFQASVLHEYGNIPQKLTLTEGVEAIYEWKGCVALVCEMERCMKNLSILPSIDDPKNTNYLKFEWNLFSICSSDNVCESAIYIIPIPSKDKLFIWYLEKGIYKGFTKKFLPVLLQKYNYKEEDVFLWNAYSDQDMKHESSLNKYPDRSTKGFYKLMYHNKTSVGNLLGQVKHQLDQLYCVLYTQKKNTRPNIATDK